MHERDKLQERVRNTTGERKCVSERERDILETNMTDVRALLQRRMMRKGERGGCVPGQQQGELCRYSCTG